MENSTLPVVDETKKVEDFSRNETNNTRFELI